MAIDVPSMSSRNHHTRNGLSSRTIITFSYVFSLFLSLAVLCLMGMSSHVDDSCLAMGGNARWLHLRQDQKRTVPYFSLFFMGKRTHMECQKTKRAETHNRASLTDNPGSFFFAKSQHDIVRFDRCSSFCRSFPRVGCWLYDTSG